MKKVMMLGLIFTWLLSPLAIAAMVVDAGNTTCPVGGEKVSGMDFVEHEGKKYGLCCAMCAGKFTKDPEKYLAKMKETSAATEATDAAEVTPVADATQVAEATQTANAVPTPELTKAPEAASSAAAVPSPESTKAPAEAEAHHDHSM